MGRAGFDCKRDGETGIGGGGEADGIGDPLVGKGGEVDGLVGGGDDQHAVGPAFPVRINDGAGYGINAGVGRRPSQTFVGELDGEVLWLGRGRCRPGCAVVGLREIVQDDGGRHFGNQENVGDGRSRRPVAIAGLRRYDRDRTGAGEGQIGQVRDLPGPGSHGEFDGQAGSGRGREANGIGDPLVWQRRKIDGLGQSVAGTREQNVGQRCGRIAENGQRGLVISSRRRREGDGEIGGASNGQPARNAFDLKKGGIRSVRGPAGDRHVGGTQVAQGEDVGGGRAPQDGAEIGTLFKIGRLGFEDGQAVRSEQPQSRRSAQDERARLTVIQARADDLVELVDARGVGQDPAGSGFDEAVEVAHRSVVPDKSLIRARSGRRSAHDPRAVVDGVGEGIVGRTIERAKIAHQEINAIAESVAPDFVFIGAVPHPDAVGRRKEIGVPWIEGGRIRRGPADDQARFVDGCGLAPLTAQCAQHFHFADFAGAVGVGVPPDERPFSILCGNVQNGIADEITAGVQAPRAGC